MKTGKLLAISLLMLTACGGDGLPVPIVDEADVNPGAEVADGQGDICDPECTGKLCGPDGCGGACGSCSAEEECSEDGKCLAVHCVSSKDCPGDLVCHEAEGRCVECVGDEDCPEDHVCAVDHGCHLPVSCKSDKDCKDFDMVCDKEPGICVQCLKAEHCEVEEYCIEGICMPDVCVGGDASCEGDTASSCLADGSGWQVTEICDDKQYCEEGECLDQQSRSGSSPVSLLAPLLCARLSRSAQKTR